MPNHATRTFDDLLFQVAEKTFGELAFLLIEPEETVPSSRHPSPMWGYAARVEFTGPFGGLMHLAITEDMLRPLAANMLGIDVDEELPEGVRREDALKELLNVTCGNLLPRIGGNEAVFHIAAPTLLSEPMSLLAANQTPAGRVQLNLDVGTAQLTFYTDQDACCDVAAPGE
jgi:CheY-specific phosphatase CheX